MDDYLVKPLNLSSLSAVLTRWVPAAPALLVHAAAGTVANRDANGTEAALDRSIARLDPLVIDRLERLGVAAGEDLLGQLTTMFLSDAAVAVTALHAALDDDDAVAVGARAHGLRGASANLGATELANLCASLSASATARDLTGGGASIQAIEAELLRVRAALTPRIPTP